MRKTKCSLFVGLLMIVLSPALGFAQDNRYANVEIFNTTSDITIHYWLRWGSDGDWGNKISLKPGESWCHSWRYNVVNENRSPAPQVTFASGINRTRTKKTYTVSAFATPEQFKGGKRFYFEKRTDSAGEDYIELAEGTYSTAKNDRPVAKPAERPIIDRTVEKKAPALDNTLAGELVKQGRALSDQGAYTAAIAKLNEALQADPQNAYAYSLRAYASMKKDDFAGAFADCDEAIRINPKHSNAFNVRGLILKAKGQYDDAVKDISAAIRLNPKDSVLYSNRASIYFAKQEYEFAVKDCGDAIELNSRSDSAYYWRALAYVRLGEVEKAKADYEKSVEINPAWRIGFDRNGRPWISAAQREEALAALQSFRWSSTLTSAELQDINSRPSQDLEPVDGPVGQLPKKTLDLISLETDRHNLLEIETIAAVDRVLNVAKLSAVERRRQGIRFQWVYGNVTSPIFRGSHRSKDELGGLRLVGHAVFADGKVINCIVPITYVPSRSRGETAKVGRTSLLKGGDNFRVEVQLFATGKSKADYGHQSFSVRDRIDGKKEMKPGLNIDRKTGMIVDKNITMASLGSQCVDCHGSGPKLGTNFFAKMEQTDYENMPGFADFLKQAVTLGANTTERAELEDMMKRDPALLFPIDELIESNRENWVNRYSAFKRKLSRIQPRNQDDQPLPPAANPNAKAETRPVRISGLNLWARLEPGF